MHELPITESILEICQRHAESAGSTRVTDVYLVIGQLASIIDDSVQFYWDIVCEGTVAEGARLHFRRIPARLRCRDCRQEYLPKDESLACPECASLRVKVIAGDEFSVEAIGVDSEDDHSGESQV